MGTKKLFIKTLVFWICVVLLASFILHTVQFDHHHPSEFGEGVEAALHGEDRKWWILCIFASILPIFYLLFARKCVRMCTNCPATRSPCSPPLTVLHPAYPLLEALSQGIVHPKLCA